MEEAVLLLEEKFDYIYYTGSITVGRLVHKAANKYLTPTTLELGGKNVVYIDDTADLKMTATRIMWGKCLMSGQVCIAPDYIICTKQVQHEFVKFAKVALEKFGKEYKSLPIINDTHFQRLKGLLSGLNIAIGGGCDSIRNLFEPTVAIDVNPNHAIMQEEIFGPILPIVTIKNFEEAINFINQRDKPLALYVFTNNNEVRDYFIENTSSGGVTVNDTLMHLMVESLPFGGVGASGMGCYKGKDSFDTFVHKKSVLVKNFSNVIDKIQSIRYPPYSKRRTDFLGLLLKSRRQYIPYDWIFYIAIFSMGFLVAYFSFKYNVLSLA